MPSYAQKGANADCPRLLRLSRADLLPNKQLHATASARGMFRERGSGNWPLFYLMLVVEYMYVYIYISVYVCLCVLSMYVYVYTYIFN